MGICFDSHLDCLVMAGGEEPTSSWASLAQGNVNGDATALSFLERLLSEYEVYEALEAETQEQEAPEEQIIQHHWVASRFWFMLFISTARNSALLSCTYSILDIMIILWCTINF